MGCVFPEEREAGDMNELSRYLFLAGAVPFLVLGTAHAIHTPLTLDGIRGLSPRSADLRRAMAQDPLTITRRTNVWLAWVGFNFSHSLGAVMFGAVVLLVGRSAASFEAQAVVFLPFAVAVSALYLVLGVRYWFRTPIAGIAFALACFLGSWLLR
jgi:hypothetical protein